MVRRARKEESESGPAGVVGAEVRAQAKTGPLRWPEDSTGRPRTWVKFCGVRPWPEFGAGATSGGSTNCRIALLRPIAPYLSRQEYDIAGRARIRSGFGIELRSSKGLQTRENKIEHWLLPDWLRTFDPGIISLYKNQLRLYT